jgi:dsRNA-specific ribonuclease
VEVGVGSDVLGVGEGRSKRMAERAAALAALAGTEANGPDANATDANATNADES